MTTFNAYGPENNKKKQSNLIVGANKLKDSSLNYKPVTSSLGSVPATEPKEEFYGENTLQKINSMHNDGYDAYKNLVNQQVEGTVSSLNKNRRNIENSYKDAYKSLVKDKDNNLRDLPETMAKLGLYGNGAGETAVSNITSEYSQQLKSLMEAKNNAVYDLDSQIENVKQQGAQQIAQYYSSLMQNKPAEFLQLLNLKFGEKQYNDNMDWQKKQWDYNVEQNNKQWEYQVNKDNEANTLTKAQLAASAGNYNPYLDLGIVTEDGKTFNENIYKQSFMPKNSGGSGSGNETVNKQLLKSRIDTDISHWLYSPENINGDGYFYNGWDENTNPIYAARDKINHGPTIRYIKDALIESGYTSKEADEKIKEYVKNINEQILKIEGKNKEE
ncbi:MAG: hypothetical protein IKZ35_02230 [Clostridia bacterium]|nr:hypothetical protein [Clostridia bacterium]